MPHIMLIKYKLHNEKKEFRLFQVIQHKWEEIGIQLRVPMHTIDRNQMEREKCWEMLEKWLENGSEKYPLEWDGLINVLKDVELREVANDLILALENTTQ